MATVYFFNSPLHGHVNPTLPVVQELVERGERVVYYLTREFEQSIYATGASFRCYVSTIEHNRPSGRFSQVLAEECRHVIPQIIESVRAEKPDYIIYEANCLWGRLLAQALQVPSISCRASLAVNEHFSHFPSLLTHSQHFSAAPFALLLDTLNDLSTIRGLCERYYLPFPENDMHSIFFYTDELNIVFVPRILQPAGDTFDERFLFVGAPIAPHKEVSCIPRNQVLKPPEIPTLYISLGTIFNAQPSFFKLCFQAFERQPWRVIMAIGKQIDRGSLGTIPANFAVSAYVPQLDILQSTTVFITHGGLNSVAEALYYGVPMVVIPQMPEQSLTANRVAELGLGVIIHQNALTMATLRDAVQSVFHDPVFTTRARHLQKEVRAAGGQRRAADAILQFISRKSLVV